jgi:hypothetical protein
MEGGVVEGGVVEGGVAGVLGKKSERACQTKCLGFGLSLLPKFDVPSAEGSAHPKKEVEQRRKVLSAFWP